MQMKKIVLLINLCLSVNSFCQVGINNVHPEATLDVRGKPENTTVFDGIIAPRLTGNQLSAKNYTVAQKGAIVYATSAAVNPTLQTKNVTADGYYYFDGSVWVGFRDATSGTDTTSSLATGVHAKIRRGAGPVLTDDHTIILTGNITLPSPGGSNKNRIINVCNTNSGARYIYSSSGSQIYMPLHGPIQVTLVDTNNKCLTFHSNGDYWYAISSFR